MRREKKNMVKETDTEKDEEKKTVIIFGGPFNRFEPYGKPIYFSANYLN